MIDPRRPRSEVRQIRLQVLVSALAVALVAAGGITVVELGGRSDPAGAHAPSRSRPETSPAAAIATTGTPGPAGTS